MIEKRIEKCLDNIRPYLRADGGDVLFKRFRQDGVLELEWVGTCRTCPMSQLTLRAGVERALLHEIPEVKRVEAVSS
ncbi:MAG: NifU family protein [Bacteroidota bacterium]